MPMITLAQLSQLTPEQRVALGAGAATRVLPLFEEDYDSADGRPRACVDLAWRVASGVSVTPDEFAAIRAAGAAAVPAPNASGAARCAAIAAVLSVDVASRRSEENLLELLGLAATAAQFFGGEDEELDWQSRAIAETKLLRMPTSLAGIPMFNEAPAWLAGDEGEV